MIVYVESIVCGQAMTSRLDDVTRAAGSATPSSKQMASPSHTIQVPGRLSLRSPMRQGPLAPSRLTNEWNAPRSPSISEIFVRQPTPNFRSNPKSLTNPSRNSSFFMILS
ncbi:hypothetical protein PSACC_02315 [Paramicrosporidium saccamoebae]|uniref:Uncharacterized protein n=1 Tax=Paramicrosporidium saccamoebae TaxID=1246581 RepID=A0A2H9TJF8_9FUNG|nr:hypothetical protein PSACC_02315 [Paramicrosporidium saccamoebae]